MSKAARRLPPSAGRSKAPLASWTVEEASAALGMLCNGREHLPSLEEVRAVTNAKAINARAVPRRTVRSAKVLVVLELEVCHAA